MIDQELINRTFAVIAKAIDSLADEIAGAAERGKDKNYSSSLKMEAAAGELKKKAGKMKTDYPHLFADEPL